jgi:integrase
VAEHLLLSNPVAGCKLPKQEKQEMKTMPIEDLGKFFAEAKACGKFEFYYLDFSTGLRRGELLGLKWEDVDFEHATISIKRQVIRVQGRIEEGPLKTKNAYRTVAVGEDVIGMLRDLKQRSGYRSPYIFPSANGGPLDPDSILPMFKRMLNRCGLETMRFHDIRHTFATVALAEGVDYKTLSMMLGHYSVAFTMDTYVHVTDDMIHDAAAKVSGVMKNTI